MHCNLKRILKAIVEDGARSLNDIKALVPNIQHPQSKISSLADSGHVTVGEDGLLEATSKGEKAVS